MTAPTDADLDRIERWLRKTSGSDHVEAADIIAELREQVANWQQICRDDTKDRDGYLAENAALRQDAERLDFLIAVTTGEGEAENDPRAVAMALAFAKGLDGRAAIDSAMREGKEKEK